MDEALKVAAQIVVDATLQNMAATAKTTPEQISRVVMADPHGATARRFAELARIGIQATREVLSPNVSVVVA